MFNPYPPTHEYDDIIDLPHHVSPTRKRMSMRERAAQFSPFAALTGYEAVIEETARLTDVERELDESRKTVLDMQLQQLRSLLAHRPDATITWFCPDTRKSGGAYLTHSGRICKIDPLAGTIRFEDQTVVPIEQITEIDSPVLSNQQ